MTSTTALFEGRMAIVNGARLGIGRATAYGWRRRAHASSRATSPRERLAELTAEHPELALVTVAGDVSTEAVAQQLVAEAGDRIDVHPNVAGIMDGSCPPPRSTTPRGNGS